MRAGAIYVVHEGNEGRVLGSSSALSIRGRNSEAVYLVNPGENSSSLRLGNSHPETDACPYSLRKFGSGVSVHDMIR
jgi:hypothetical protein